MRRCRMLPLPTTATCDTDERVTGSRDAYQRGREDERDAIVAWLRAKPPVSVLAAFLAAEIERGEHAGVKA